MKNEISKPSRRRVSQGFTLVETVIAMGIITIMITAFLAAFGPAVQGIRKSISAKEANRLATSLEYELTVLRFEEAGDSGEAYTTPFEKAFEWIKESGGTDKDQSVLLYQYRGDPESVREDGTLYPQVDKEKNTPGVDYVLQSAVRRLGDDRVREELVPGVVEGRVFYVRMIQMVHDNDELKVAGTDGAPGGLGQIIDPTEPRSAVSDYSNYPEAVIAIQARFYVFKSSLFVYADKAFKLDDKNDDGHPDSVGRPIHIRNMAIRR